MSSDRIETYWQSYLRTLPADSPVHNEQYDAGIFGDSAELANELGALIVKGIKTATCSALWEQEAEGSPIPEVGEGDRSLAYWREAHWRYFSRVLAKIGMEPAVEMLLVCERFRVIYP